MKGLTDLRPVADAPCPEELLIVDMPHLDPDDLSCFVGHPTPPRAPRHTPVPGRSRRSCRSTQQSHAERVTTTAELRPDTALDARTPLLTPMDHEQTGRRRRSYRIRSSLSLRRLRACGCAGDGRPTCDALDLASGGTRGRHGFRGAQIRTPYNIDEVDPTGSKLRNRPLQCYLRRHRLRNSSARPQT